MTDNKKNVPGPEQLESVQETGDDAAKEAAGFADKNLDKISKEAEHGRRERFRDHVSCGAVIVFWVLIVASLAAVLVVVWHYLAPKSLAWLSEDQLTALRTYIFSSAVVAAAGGYVRRYLI